MKNCIVRSDLAPWNRASYNARQREKRLTKELKEDGKKELHSRADHRQVTGSREPHCNQGKTIIEACGGLESRNKHIIYYRWRKEREGMKPGNVG